MSANKRGHAPPGGWSTFNISSCSKGPPNRAQIRNSARRSASTDNNCKCISHRSSNNQELATDWSFAKSRIGRMFRNLDWQLAFLAYHPAYDIFKLPLSLKNQSCGGSEYRWDYLAILVNLDLMRNMNDKSN